MKIDSEGLDSAFGVRNQKAKGNIDAVSKSGNLPQNRQISGDSKEFGIENRRFSSLAQKEQNNNAGILQIAKNALQNILQNSQITLSAVNNELENAQFMGRSVFSEGVILRDERGETLFDSGRILEILPNDERDLYMFKKALKNEVAFIENSLHALSNASALDGGIIDSGGVKDYLTNNAILFAKAHNTAALASKIDALLL